VSNSSTPSSTPSSRESQEQQELDEFDAAMTPSEQLACELALSDIQLLNDLRDARVRQGLSEAQLGAKLGISAESVQEFEGLQTQPTLATVRRYAHALGMIVRHRVSPFEQ